MTHHKGLPKTQTYQIYKTQLLKTLLSVDLDETARKRTLDMEVDFRRRINTHILGLPTTDARFSKFSTNPFVLMFHSHHKQYRHVGEIEADILPAKLFSSMETSAGRMVEQVVLPNYGWATVPSEMHSSESVIDAKQIKDGVLRLATLKSGPRCLNDEMSKDIADDIIKHSVEWARSAGVKEIDFTYGVLYGTKKQSNKKDWHILRNLVEKLPKGSVKIAPTDRWDMKFVLQGVTVKVTVRIGQELWNYMASDHFAFVEITVALLRACISPSEAERETHVFTISDLNQIISLSTVPEDFNVSIIQYSQIEWFFFFARHFCDELIEG